MHISRVCVPKTIVVVVFFFCDLLCAVPHSYFKTTILRSSGWAEKLASYADGYQYHSLVFNKDHIQCCCCITSI